MVACFILGTTIETSIEMQRELLSLATMDSVVRIGAGIRFTIDVLPVFATMLPQPQLSVNSVEICNNLNLFRLNLLSADCSNYNFLCIQFSQPTISKRFR